MEIIVFLVFCSLSLAIIFLIAFIWSLKTGQFDDDYTPAMRMLIDEKMGASKTVNQHNQIEIVTPKPTIHEK
jgi:cbb3-type cytochrome oxidase maturation protein